MFLRIKDATYIEDYTLKVVFNNGQEGIADLTPALKGTVFEALKDKDLFASFVVDKDLETITWSNGADLAPEYIYFQAFKEESSLQSQFKKWGYIA
jgi:hypothetical protein